jgi:hypothetical protein
MTTKLFYYNFSNNDFRSGPTLEYYDSDDVDYQIDDFHNEIELSLPSKKYIVYIIADNNADPKIIISKEFNEISNGKNFLLQTYSLINGMSPFVVTGWTASYKETGAYGPAIPITYNELKKFNIDLIDGNSYVHGIIITKNGDVLDTLAITPPE